MLGLQLLGETILEVKQHMRPELQTLGYLVTSYDKRLGLTGEVVEKLEEKYGDLVFKTRIRTNANLKVAPAHRRDVLQFEAKLPKPRKGLDDYTALAAEVAKRLRLAPSLAA